MLANNLVETTNTIYIYIYTQVLLYSRIILDLKIIWVNENNNLLPYGLRTIFTSIYSLSLSFFFNLMV